MSGLSRPSVLVGGIAVAGISGICLYLLLRREEEWRSQRQSNISSSKQVVIDVKIPKESVGVVIGREGSNIKEIQAKTDTRINFKDELETETHRVAGIRGLPADVSYAEILIHQTIANQPRLERVTMYVPVSSVGRIIGRQGDNIRVIQTVSGCKVDVERAEVGSTALERKVMLKGTSQQISQAKKMIEEKVSDGEWMRNSVTNSRQPRVKTTQPLFLNYQDDSNEEANINIGWKQEALELIGGDNVMEVFVSGVESPSEFYVQKIGSRSVELDKLTAEMTQFYEEETNRKLMSLSAVEAGDVVAAKFSDEENYYRAKIVSVEENSYDYDQSTVELFFVDYGDSDTRGIADIFELKTEYLKLKFQAIKVSLAGVKPYPGPTWSDQSIEYFCQISHSAMWKDVLAKIKGYNEENVPSVELIDSSQNGLNIGEELIRQEFALRDEN